MKKLILLLALALGVEVKGQIVGGYLPINSSKTPTMGGLRVNGTSTFTGNALFSSSVGIGALPTSALSSFNLSKGNATINLGEASSGFSSIWLHKSPTSSNYVMSGDANGVFINGASAISFMTAGTVRHQMTATGLRLGANTNPNNTLDVTGTMSVSSTATVAGALTAQSTMSLGSANLTGGNTGTVAVLSDVPFALNFTAYNSTPSDATTYYFGNATADWGSMTFQGNGKVYMPYNCTFIGWTANFSGTAGSAETSTLSINIDNSATNLSTAITMSVNNVNTYSATGLSISINSGSYIEAKLITPTWVTNPSSTKVGITLWFIRRS